MKTQAKDYYRLLGVRPDATVLLIKKAYRKLAKQYHPDVNHSPDAADRFREITEAYDTLTDPDRRRRYDRLHGFGHATSGTDDGSSRYYRTRDSTHRVSARQQLPDGQPDHQGTGRDLDGDPPLEPRNPRRS